MIYYSARQDRRLTGSTFLTRRVLDTRIGVMRALNRHVERVFNPERKDTLGEAQTQEGPMTVLIYVDTSKQVLPPWAKARSGLLNSRLAERV